MPKIINPTNLPDLNANKVSASDIPALEVEGDAVTRYNNASDAKKDAEAVMKELRPELIDAGLKFLFEKNYGIATDKERIKSVKLQSADDEEPEICMLSMSDKVTKLDPKAVSAGLTALKVNPNDCVEYVVEAAFDTSIFYDKDGKWVQSRFDKVSKAMIEVARELKTVSPLACGNVLKAKPGFYLDRHRAFTIRQNLAIQDVVPCSVSLEPVRAKE